VRVMCDSFASGDRPLRSLATTLCDGGKDPAGTAVKGR
jgi:hypothetical protein